MQPFTDDLMTLEKLTLPHLEKVGDDLDFVKAEIVRRYNLFPELVQALEDLDCWLIAPDTSPEILAEMKIKCAYALTHAKEVRKA